jgi:phosphatidate cytidylyltransferase
VISPWSVLAPVIGLFAFGALMIAVFGRRARHPGAAGELWRYYASTGLIVAAILLPAALHPLLFILVVVLATWRCAHELAAVFGLAVPMPLRLLFPLLLLAAAWAGGARFYGVLPALLAFALPVYLVVMRTSKPPSGRPLVLWPATLIFPLLAAVSLAQLIYRQDGFLWVFLLYATVETQDSMAFLFGRLFGKRPVLPRLSPRKTSEGVLAGVLFGGAMAAGLAQGLLDRSPSQALGLAALLVFAGLTGDLFTSRLKRVAGVKDFPAISSLHGGVLDIYDSTLFAAIPLALLSLA